MRLGSYSLLKIDVAKMWYEYKAHELYPANT